MKYLTLKLNFQCEIFGDYKDISQQELDELVHDLKSRLSIALINVKLPAYLDIEVEDSTQGLDFA